MNKHELGSHENQAVNQYIGRESENWKANSHPHFLCQDSMTMADTNNENKPIIWIEYSA